MQIEGWKYYNHAMVPTIAPNESPNIRSIEDGSIWKVKGTPLLARWTTDWDCGFETNWWYVIKDEPFEMEALKSKQRYEVNKGNKNFEIKIINPVEYREELYRIQVAAFSAYPKKYRPSTDKERFINSIETWNDYDVFGAFSKGTDELAGYALLKAKNCDFLNFAVLKVKPIMEKCAVNAALVYGVVSHYEDFLKSGGIICDGARNIYHETHFQDYLEKYFGFRKAYCHLYIQYNPRIKWLIKLLFPLRKALTLLDGVDIFHSINGVLKMEEICRCNRLDSV